MVKTSMKRENWRGKTEPIRFLFLNDDILFLHKQKQICCCSHIWIQYSLCLIVFSLHPHMHISSYFYINIYILYILYLLYIYIYTYIHHFEIMCILLYVCSVYPHTSTWAHVLSGVTSTMDPDPSLHCAPRKCRAITEMLTERVVLRAAPTDRVLLGAKNLLLKYTLCSLAHYVGIQKVLESLII